jgi:alkylation response protein AidB-like acyl-CoA dehydrogenase
MNDTQTRFEHCAAVAREHAGRVDKEGSFPSEAIEALRERGLFGLLSAKEVGGLGGTLRDAALGIRTLATACASTAMVTCMHFAGASVIEKFGRRPEREAIARGEHLSTLAFSEAGSRSHFWAPMSTAKPAGSGFVLDADKSWITSASHATAYVWSSKPVAAEGASTLWLVPRTAPGLTVTRPFDGLGLRGNDSAPVQARGVAVDAAAMLGGDGKGFDVMMGVVLPAFNVMNAATSIGLMEESVRLVAAHAGATRYENAGMSVRDFPTARASIARMRVRCDMAATLWLDTIAALEAGREDAQLRVLECKAACNDAALEVLDLAMRVAGGAAFRRDVPVERFFRDARAGSIMAPTSDVLYDFIGKAATGLPLF